MINKMLENLITLGIVILGVIAFFAVVFYLIDRQVEKEIKAKDQKLKREKANPPDVNGPFRVEDKYSSDVRIIGRGHTIHLNDCEKSTAELLADQMNNNDAHARALAKQLGVDINTVGGCAAVFRAMQAEKKE